VYPVIRRAATHTARLDTHGLGGGLIVRLRLMAVVAVEKVFDKFRSGGACHQECVHASRCAFGWGSFGVQ
jgi:hypothetical protein